ncbi:MAG: cysteine desulfurase family protein [Armatimonas sp.]
MIYLDHAATTPVAPEVRDAMLPYLGERFGNPSSIHQLGQEARRALDGARDTVAEALGAESSEMYFTSGGTEAGNLAILGTLLATRETTGRTGIITNHAEHHCVLDAAHYAQALGFSVKVLPVDAQGRVLPEAVAEAIDDNTALVSIMHANNELGTIQPIAELAALAHAHEALFHTDAVQTLGAMPLSVTALGADLLSISGHKIYGPKGTGALYVRKGVKLYPLFHGGSQERQKRPGTENVAGIIGFGEAVRQLPNWREEAAAHMTTLRQLFWDRLQEAIPGVALNGVPFGPERLPANLNVQFPKKDAETILLALDFHGIAASAGSACASGSLEPSHVLVAIGLSLTDARASVRFSLGRKSTEAEVHKAVDTLAQIVNH